MRTRSPSLGAILLGLSASVLAFDDDAISADYSARWRTEQVKQENQKSIDLSSIKFRLNVSAALSDQYAAVVEVDAVQHVLGGYPNDGVFSDGRPSIVDPEGVELNQAYLGFKNDDWQWQLGRQRIGLSEHRFVGDVGFRQNDQTFDALRVSSEYFSDVILDYAWLNRSHRPFGRDANSFLDKEDARHLALNGLRPSGLLGQHRLNGHLFQAQVKQHTYIDWQLFALHLDNKDAPSLSNQTLSLQANLKRKINNHKWFASIGAAVQKRQDTNASGSRNYALTELGVKYKLWSLSGRYEYFGSNNGQSFITPLATLHKFQGWADQFLVTPSQGLVDSSLRLQWQQRPIHIDFRFHQYETAQGGIKLGKEYNLDLIFSPDRKHEFKLRFADFRAADNQTLRPNNVTKLFLMYSYNLK